MRDFVARLMNCDKYIIGPQLMYLGVWMINIFPLTNLLPNLENK